VPPPRRRPPRCALPRGTLVAGFGLSAAFAGLHVVKSVNDSHGQAVGDEVLRWFAGVVRDQTDPPSLQGVASRDPSGASRSTNPCSRPACQPARACRHVGPYQSTAPDCAMAHLGTGREAAVTALPDRMTDTDGSETAGWVSRIGRPLVRGLRDFRAGRCRDAAMARWETRHIAGAFGDSHAQRDVIDWTLTEAALRGGMAGRAGALAAECPARRPHSAVNRRLLLRSRANAAGA